MNKNEVPSSFRGKGAAVGIVIGFVAVIIMVGAYTFNNYNKKLAEQLAKSEELTQQIANEKSQTATSDEVLPLENENQGNSANGAQGNASGNTAGTTSQSTQEQEATDNSEENPTAAATAHQLSFGEDSLLEWPASGAVLINYSMDKTVFFSTLEQYKYNPALIISGKVGEEIAASAAGVVVGIEEAAQTGLTVILDMGGGYTATYGQLKELSVAIGDYVETGERIGYLSEPTKYFTMEGPNLYFRIMRGDESVNPLNYMDV